MLPALVLGTSSGLAVNLNLDDDLETTHTMLDSLAAVGIPRVRSLDGHLPAAPKGRTVVLWPTQRATPTERSSRARLGAVAPTLARCDLPDALESEPGDLGYLLVGHPLSDGLPDRLVPLATKTLAFLVMRPQALCQTP